VGTIRTRYAREAYLSLLVFPDGYTAGELAEVQLRAQGYNGNTVFVSLGSMQELVSYLNTRTTDGSYDYRANERILLKEVRVFSHGLPSSLAFGLDVGDPQAGALAFGIAEVAGLKAEAWNPGASLSSFACRTGNTDWSESFGDDWRAVAKPEKSLGQALAEQLGVKVRGYITRSNYARTFGEEASSDEAQKANYKKGYQDQPHPGATVASGFHPFSNAKPNFACWNQQGAFADPESGKTPKGLNENNAGGTWIFEKGKDPRQE
jgi:hypothetical protein